MNLVVEMSTTISRVSVQLLVAAVALISVCFISLLLLTDFYTSFWRMGPVLIGLYLLAIVSARRHLWRPPSWWLAIVALAVLLLSPFAILLRTYGYVDLISIQYHLQAGITRQSLSVVWRPLVVVTAACLFFGLAVYHLGVITRRQRLISVLALILLVALHPLASASLDYFRVQRHSLSLSDRITTPALAAEPRRPDIVIIYLEGLEQGYANQELFGDSYTPLKELWPEALVLTNVAQIEGTGWSIAGMVASQCGLPLLPSPLTGHNFFSVPPDFLTRHICLGDVLASQGYESRFIVGAEASFGGISEFYMDHGITEIIEGVDFHETYPAEEIEVAHPGWTVDDEMVFDMGRRVYLKGLQSGRPQALIIETYGPHGPEHLVSRRCTGNGRAVLTDDPRPSVRCLAELAVEFVRFVQARSGGRETVFVLLSDHLSHDRHMRRLLADEPRRNTVILMGAGRLGEVAGSLASMVDVYPTLLQYTGLAPAAERAGLGVSLLSSHPTLVQEFGLSTLDRQLRFDSEIRAAIWRDN